MSVSAAEGPCAIVSPLAFSRITKREPLPRPALSAVNVPCIASTSAVCNKTQLIKYKLCLSLMSVYPLYPV